MHPSLGLAIIVFSGLLIASFAAPMKFARAWKLGEYLARLHDLASALIPLVLVMGRCTMRDVLEPRMDKDAERKLFGGNAVRFYKLGLEAP